MAVLVALIASAAGVLTASHLGRLVLLAGLAILPLVVTGAGVAVGVRESSQTQFCMSCHEMEPYGKSLFVDNPTALSAVHYQKRLISRDTTCYACHTDYALFGDAKAKLNGLKHVWVHYFGTIPERPKLYQPYPNYNCLHCHSDARSFLEAPPHQDLQAELQSGAKSCLGCHDLAHDLEGVKAQNFWLPERRP
ncbi:NapC/NirT family cytochrome c [Myxococcus sp. K15C18031901]|uniref:NapC/NirT family cytochrome c n=1 Tax=Myxococcus dinghuensis TaxID=2906761 RepID=UPI0020A81E94|nr:NapC/NirT family cytochrome c [Myxococcus dinghuensis]MCP3097962.1 NapC/NirT family cytochrome c [Myxococcus dinghuensis]